MIYGSARNTVRTLSILHVDRHVRSSTYTYWGLLPHGRLSVCQKELISNYCTLSLGACDCKLCSVRSSGGLEPLETV